MDNHTSPQKEAEANMFAMEILMPEEDVRQQAKGLDLMDDKVVSKLAKRYGVENSVMSMRLFQLHQESK
jgi:Zn-dependent peptidase ImmA (M78 family)